MNSERLVSLEIRQSKHNAAEDSLHAVCHLPFSQHGVFFVGDVGGNAHAETFKQ